jgi:hypothetical protein
MLPDLSALGFCRIISCPISNLARTKVLGGVANSILQIFPPYLEGLSVAPNATDDHVHVRVFCIVVGDCDPFEISPEIHCQAIDKLARETFQIYSVAEFGRQDHFPQARIARRLPSAQFAGDIDAGSVTIEANLVAFARGRGLTGKISAVSLPLPARSVV